MGILEKANEAIVTLKHTLGVPPLFLLTALLLGCLDTKVCGTCEDFDEFDRFERVAFSDISYPTLTFDKNGAPLILANVRLIYSRPDSDEFPGQSISRRDTSAVNSTTLLFQREVAGWKNSAFRNLHYVGRSDYYGPYGISEPSGFFIQDSEGQLYSGIRDRNRVVIYSQQTASGKWEKETVLQNGGFISGWEYAMVGAFPGGDMILVNKPSSNLISIHKENWPSRFLDTSYRYANNLLDIGATRNEAFVVAEQYDYNSHLEESNSSNSLLILYRVDANSFRKDTLDAFGNSFINSCNIKNHKEFVSLLCRTNDSSYVYEIGLSGVKRISQWARLNEGVFFDKNTDKQFSGSTKLTSTQSCISQIDGCDYCLQIYSEDLSTVKIQQFNTCRVSENGSYSLPLSLTSKADQLNILKLTLDPEKQPALLLSIRKNPYFSGTDSLSTNSLNFQNPVNDPANDSRLYLVRRIGGTWTQEELVLKVNPFATGAPGPANYLE